MRPRPLRQDNLVIRAAGYADLSVTAGEVFSQAASAPAAGGLLKQSWKTANSLFEGLTEEEREAARENQRQRDLRKSALEAQLDVETDEIRRENILGEITSLYQEPRMAKDEQVQRMIDDGRLVSPDVLNEEFGDMVTFDEPMSREKAELFYKNKREQVVRNAIMEKGLDDVAGYSALFAGSLVSAAVDPVELGAAFIPFFGPAKRAQMASRFGKVRGATIIGTGEGFAGALLTEPLYYGLSKQQQLDYSMGDALLNVGVGTFLGSGVGTIRGIFSPKQIDYKAASEMAKPEVDVITDTQPVVIPPTRDIPQEELDLKAKTAAKNSIANHNVLGGVDVAQTALQQLVTDQAVNVKPVMPKSVSRPDHIVEFIKRSGGINDKDVTFRGELSSMDARSVKGYYTKSGKYVVPSISNPDGLSLDQMAELAAEAGYISKRDTNELTDAIRETLRGNYKFAAEDLDAAEDWRAISDAINDFEADIEARENVRLQLVDLGFNEPSDDVVALITSDMNRRGVSVEEAAETFDYSMRAAESEILARHGNDPESDIAADFNASARFDEFLDQTTDDVEAEIDAEIVRDDQIIRQLSEAGDLDEQDLASLAELEAVEAHTDAYKELTEAATFCMMRP